MEEKRTIRWTSEYILVPRGRAPFGQHQESRPLARSNDIPVLNGSVNTIDWDQNQPDLSDLTLSMRRVTGRPWIADFRNWTWPEVAILGADQRSAASGDENVRNRAMESMCTTQKRKKGNGDKDSENAPKPKITRRSGGDTVTFLREKNDMVQKWKAKDLEWHKKRLEVESRKQDEFQKQQQAMIQMMAQQHQQFQMFAAMQWQQTQVILKLLEKQTKWKSAVVKAQLPWVV